MNFDFPLIMVVAVFFTGIVWAVDALVFLPKRKVKVANFKQEHPDMPEEKLNEAIAPLAKEHIVVEYSRSLFPVILIVLLLRSFLVEPFKIPSGSMMPTLLVGDFILVNKFSYGVRLPVADTKIIDVGEPQRGDVIVFRFPENPSLDYIKRVVGLPGDRILYQGKKLYVNGKLMEQTYEGIFQGVGQGINMTGAALRTEQLGEVAHQLLTMNTHHSNTMSYTDYVVPEGHYFVMGDNRDNSNDSRYWGPVPEENLVGKAFMVWMNLDWHNEQGKIDWSRIGNDIK